MKRLPGEHVVEAVERSVDVPCHVLDEIQAHAARESPNECCGLLLGTPERIARAHPARNELSSPTRYRIRPEDHFAAVRAARAEGLEVIGAYHSHPASSPIPSALDLEESVGGGFLYVIAGREPSCVPRLRAWRLRDGNFVPVPLVTLQ